MSTKACHLEAVTALIAAAFFNTSKRFMGRRGKFRKYCTLSC